MTTSPKARELALKLSHRRTQEYTEIAGQAIQDAVGELVKAAGGTPQDKWHDECPHPAEDKIYHRSSLRVYCLGCIRTELAKWGGEDGK